MKILVTGGTGRLGMGLKRALRGSGETHSVFLGSPRSPAGSGAGAGLDVTDRGAVNAAIAEIRPDVVIHLASLAGAACDLDPEHTQSVNVDAVRWVSEAAVKNGVSRVVFASTGGVYGSSYSTPVDEFADIRLGSRYAQSKFAAEEILRSAALEFPQMQSVILRIFNVYGPAFDDSLISRLIRSTPTAPTPLVGLDHFVRDYSEVSTVVSALLSGSTAHLDAPTTTFNIGSGVATSTRTLLAMLGRHVHYTVTGDARSYSCANIEAAKAALNFVPSVPEKDIPAFSLSGNSRGDSAQ